MVVLTSRQSLTFWAGWVVFAILLMPLVGPWHWIYLFCIAGSALLLQRLARWGGSQSPGHPESRDLAMIAAFYGIVVVFMWLAFVGFGTDNVLGLFLCFATALLLGVIGPIVYTVWTKSGSLHDLGLRRDDLKTTLTLALVFATVQFAITLWGYDMPATVDWVPLLVMALVVGIFESVFFRGFIQNRLEAHYGPTWGIGAAAVLYGLYHLGYGMGWTDIAFLTGLGITYAVAFALARNLLVLWPLLTPLGSFYAQLEAGDIELPWASIMGFADVAMLMAGALWIAHRHEQKRRNPSAALVA
jgi:membrane protease YdiL (CAAX protease family)